MRHMGCDGDSYDPSVPCECAGCEERERLREEQERARYARDYAARRSALEQSRRK